jgi:hypothetical protein
MNERDLMRTIREWLGGNARLDAKVDRLSERVNRQADRISTLEGKVAALEKAQADYAPPELLERLEAVVGRLKAIR